MFLLIIICIENKFTTIEWMEIPILEFLWTALPAIILLRISSPSLIALYNHETDDIFRISLKITANQWYWNYEYSSFENVEFDRYTKPTEELELGEFRLIDVDNRAVVPIGLNIQILLTRNDVIHSFALPALRTKIDANPGYLNSTYLKFDYPSVFFGLCRELCGAGHRTISIRIESTTLVLFKKWISTFYI